MTLRARGAALAAVVVLCAAVTAACGADHDAGGRRPASGTTATPTDLSPVTPDPSATDLTDLTRIVDGAESAAAAAESDGADDD